MKSRRVRKILFNPNVYLVVILIAIIYSAWYFKGSFIDDTFISFRFAENFVNGHGLVFNIGEKVEGYTNFLWVILLAVFMKLGADMIVTSQVLGLIFHIATVYLVYRFSKFISGENNLFNIIAALFLTVNIAFIMWSIHGLETALFTFLIFLSMYRYVWEISKEKEIPLSSVFLAIATMARPEGALVFAITFLHRIIHYYGQKKWISKNILWSTGFLVVYLPYFFWRFSYYGFIFPNTFYAKTGGGYNQYIYGLKYTFNFLSSTRWVFLALPFMLFVKKLRKSWLIYFMSVGIFYALYVTYIGGDLYPAFRFFIPIFPLVYIVFQEEIRYLDKYLRIKKLKNYKYFIFFPVIFFLIFTYTGSKPGTFREFIGAKGFVDKMTFVGKWLRMNVPEDSVIALSPVGALPYYSKLRTIDIVGLTDAHIAHTKMQMPDKFRLGQPGYEKGDSKYILSRRPNYIFLRNVWVGTVKIEESNLLINTSEEQIWEEPEFHRLYKPVNIKLQGGYLGFYELKDNVK